MNIAHALKAGVSRFASDRSGNFAVLTGLVASTLMLAVGFGVNLTQTFQVKSSLRNALDAAVTSTARDLTTGKIEAKDADKMIKAFLTANGDTRFADSGLFSLDSLVVDPVAKTVTAKASAHVDIAFPLFGGGKPEVAVTSAAVYSDRTIEVSMVLDMTGSMAGKKIADLKTAATNAVNTFLDGQDPKNPRVRVAIVPYADSVNTGPLQSVVFTEKGFTTGEPPKLTDPASASTPVEVSATTPVDACATERKGAYEFTDASPYVAMVNRDYRVSYCPPSPLMPLTADIDALETTISKFKANGYTGGHIGIQWGWYMLSPQWNSLMPKASQARAYNDKKSSKYAIIMTDGEFNTAYAGVAKSGDIHNQPALSRNNAERLCDAMKKDGIEVFTVGFMLEEAGARAVLQDCANKDSGSVKHFFQAANGTELDAAFQQIARNIERLTLTK